MRCEGKFWALGLRRWKAKEEGGEKETSKDQCYFACFEYTLFLFGFKRNRIHTHVKDYRYYWKKGYKSTEIYERIRQ